jgi:O-antigen/teichoic acid export membrane protein
MSGYVARAGTQLAILWAFAYTAGAAGAGEFALALAVSSPVFALFELALRNVYQTLAAPPNFGVFLAVRTVGASVACLVVVGMAALIGSFPTLAVLIPLLVMKFADSVLDICFARLQVLHKVSAVAGWLWINSALTLVLIAVAVAAGGSAEATLIASAGASWLVLLTLLPRLWPLRERGHSADWQLRRVLRSGIALGLAQTMGSLFVYLPTIFLAATESRETVGVFAACQYAVTLANLLFNSVMQTWLSPLRAAMDAHGLRGLRQSASRIGAALVLAGLVLGTLAATMLPIILPWAFGGSFQVSYWAALPIGLTIVLLGAEYATTAPLLVANRYGSRIVNSGVGLGAALIAASVLPTSGVAAAGCVLLSGVATRCGYSAWVLRGVYVYQDTRHRQV